MKLNLAVSMRLQELLIEKGMTQYKLFKRSGVPRSSIRNIIECTYSTMQLQTIYDISLGLDISLEEFFNSPLFQANNLEDD